MANLGWIKFGVSADTGKFAKDMQHAAKETENFGATLRSLAVQYAGFEASRSALSGSRNMSGARSRASARPRFLASASGCPASHLASLPMPRSWPMWGKTSSRFRLNR